MSGGVEIYGRNAAKTILTVPSSLKPRKAVNGLFTGAAFGTYNATNEVHIYTSLNTNGELRFSCTNNSSAL